MTAPRTFQIQVSLDHIANGRRGNLVNCPIAIALLEHGSEVIWVHQQTTTVRNRDHGNLTYYHHDEPIQDWVRDFDAGEKVPPFTLIVTEHPDGEDCSFNFQAGTA